MRNQVADIAALTNDDDGICASQALASAGNLTINGALATGGVASWDVAQIITVTSAGNDSGITFTITGPDPDGRQISQTITGANAGAAVTTYFFTGAVTISASGAVATTVKVGVVATNGGISRSLRVNGQQMNFKVDYILKITGTLTASVQYTLDQPEDEYATSYSVNADWRAVDSLSAVSASAVSNSFYKVNAARLLISAYTSGTAKLTVGQSY